MWPRYRLCDHQHATPGADPVRRPGESGVSPAAQPIRDGLAAYGANLDLNPESLLTAATERTGLDDFGDPAFRERLDVLCTSLRDEAGLCDTGVAIAFEQLVGNLVNRLRLEALIADHPEIEDVDIERPVIICGLPEPAPRICTTCSPRTLPCAICPTGRAWNRCRDPARTPTAAPGSMRCGPGTGERLAAGVPADA